VKLKGTIRFLFVDYDFVLYQNNDGKGRVYKVEDDFGYKLITYGIPSFREPTSKKMVAQCVDDSEKIACFGIKILVKANR